MRWLIPFLLSTITASANSCGSIAAEWFVNGMVSKVEEGNHIVVGPAWERSSLAHKEAFAKWVDCFITDGGKAGRHALVRLRDYRTGKSIGRLLGPHLDLD